MNPSDSGFLAARQALYITVPQMNWAAWTLLIFSAASGVKRWRMWTEVAALTCAILWSVAFVKLDRWLAVQASGFHHVQRVARDMRAGCASRAEIVEYVHPDYETVVRGASELRRARLSIYADAR